MALDTSNYIDGEPNTPPFNRWHHSFELNQKLELWEDQETESRFWNERLLQFLEHIYSHIQNNLRESEINWVEEIDYDENKMIIYYNLFWEEKSIQLAPHENSQRFRNSAMEKL